MLSVCLVVKPAEQEDWRLDNSIQLMAFEIYGLQALMLFSSSETAVMTHSTVINCNIHALGWYCDLFAYS